MKTKSKNKHAQAMAHLRTKKLSKKRRIEIAKIANKARWNKGEKLSTEMLA